MNEKQSLRYQVRIPLLYHRGGLPFVSSIYDRQKRSVLRKKGGKPCIQR